MALEDGGSYPPGYIGAPEPEAKRHHRRAYVVPAVAVTVVGLVAIGLGEDIPTRHAIEHKLTDASEAALTRSGVPYDSVSFSGRDGTVRVESSDAAAQAKPIVADVEGVRVVHVIVAGAASPTVTASPTPTVSLTVEPSAGPGLTGLPASPSPSGSAVPSTSPPSTPSAAPSPTPSPSASTSASASAGGGSGGGTLTPSQVQAELNRLGEITFDSGSSKLTARDKTIVAKVAAILKANPSVRIRVQGDTDSIGPSAFNLTMSRRRANAVASALEALGISSDRLTIVGYGETKPLVPNTTPENRHMNRRVDFTTY